MVQGGAGRREGARRGDPPRGPRVTHDPLAAVHARPPGLYAVSRVNPLYEEAGPGSGKASAAPESPESPGKSGSSGYGGNSSDCSSSSAGSRSGDAKRSEPTLLVLRRDAAFVASVALAGPLGPPPSPPPHEDALGPIPEGVADVVPRPVWPRCSSESSDSGAEDALRRLSETLSGSRHLTRVTRALGASSASSSSASPPSSSSSSSAGSVRGGRSSSGFSEITPPGSARRQSPAPPPALPPPTLLPAALLAPAAAPTAPAARRHALIYGTLRRAPPGYEQLRGPPCTTPGLLVAPAGSPSDKQQQQQKEQPVAVSAAGAGGIGGGGGKDGGVGGPIFALTRPDFTLDASRAERLLHKLREAKRRRKLCRFVTPLLALALFLAAVVAASALLTRGKRVFGPI